MRRRQSLRAVLLLCCCCRAWLAQAQALVEATTASGAYDPCTAPPKSVNNGDPFVFGLAFWPGGTVANWGETYNATTGVPGLNPCLTNEKITLADGTTQQSYQKYLNERGVVFATYMVKVDTISAIRQTRAEMDQIWKKLLRDATDSAVISVVAFRGQNRSEAQYIRSNVTAQTEGTGIVQQLSLLVSWDRGSFSGFQWFNAGPCDSCGGLLSGDCVQTQFEPAFQRYPMSACAASFESCACNLDLGCPSNNCTTSVYMGHRGSDRVGRTMKTGSQIEQINKYSITSWFWKLLDGAFNIVGNSGIGTLGSGTAQAAPVVLGGDTDAALAQGQSDQQSQGQPLSNAAA